MTNLLDLSKELPMVHDILIVDDEADICMLISDILKDEGMSTRKAQNADEALLQIQQYRPTLIILDIWLQGSRLDGLELLDEMKRDHPDIPVLIISGHGTIATAVEAIKKGAAYFIEKPFQTESLLLMITQAMEATRLKRENAELRIRAGDDYQLIGQSHAMNQLRITVDKVASTNSRVLISGPAGSGKKTVARLIHQRSRRSQEAFVVFNCAHFEPTQVAQHLFGTEQRKEGNSCQIGILEQANRGTLLLDEVSALPLAIQCQLSRILQEHTVTRLGGEQRITIDVRVLASTSKNLEHEIAIDRFFPDLYYRLNVVPIHIPALKERRGDIALLANHFMIHNAKVSGLSLHQFNEEALSLLKAYDWPGNVRQLRNIIEWLLIMRNGEDDQPISPNMLPAEIGSHAPTTLKWEKGSEIMQLTLRKAREIFEREYLLMQILRFDGNISRTATFIGMERTALHRKLKTLGVIQ